MVLLIQPLSAYAYTNYVATIGTLTIFSCNDGGSSSWNTSGHAWISFKNFTHPAVEFGGLNVAINSEVTIGTFGNMNQHSGIWYNLESYAVNQMGAYSNRVSLSMNITRAQLEEINTIIDENDTWALLNNCSSFAVKIWNEVSDDRLSAGSPNTPTSLCESIKSYDYYQTGRSIVYNSTSGYVSGGIFYSSNPYVASASAIGSIDVLPVSVHNEVNDNGKKYFTIG